VTRLLPPSLYDLNPASPVGRSALEDEYRRLEHRIEEKQRELARGKSPSRTHTERLRNQIDLLDAQLSELHRILYSPEVHADQIECRAQGCRTLLSRREQFDQAGMCADCFKHALSGTTPQYDPTLLPAPVIGSPWGREA
jgi:hypothetical protein